MANTTTKDQGKSVPPSDQKGTTSVHGPNDPKVQAELAKEESKRGGLDPVAPTPAPIANDPDTLKKALSPAGDTGRVASGIDDPSRVGRLDAVEVAKGHTSSEGAVSQTSAALTGAGTEEPDLGALAPEPKRSPIFAVKNPQRITVSWKGQEVRLDPGSTISEDSYGDGAIEMFRNGGVLLEEVK